MFTANDKKVKDSVIAEYKKILYKNLIWRSQLNSHHKVNAIDTLAMSDNCALLIHDNQYAKISLGHPHPHRQ